MKVQSSENKLVITEEFIFDQNKLPSDPNNHFNVANMSVNAIRENKILAKFFEFTVDNHLRLYSFEFAPCFVI